MAMIKARSILLGMLLMACRVTAFMPPPPTTTSHRQASCSNTQLHVMDFFNTAKKQLVKSMAGRYDAEAIQARLNHLIGTNKAKELLKEKQASVFVLELDQDQDGTALRAELADRVGRTSVPAIWIDGTFVGGCNDGPGIMTLNKNGQLDDMLRAAGAVE